MQWLRGRTSDSTKRSMVRILCCCVKPWASLFTLHCSSSLSCMNEHLPIDSGEYLCTCSFHKLIAAWLNSSQKSWDGVWLTGLPEDVVKSTLSNPKDCILCYVRSWLYLHLFISCHLLTLSTKLHLRVGMVELWSLTNILNMSSVLQYHCMSSINKSTYKSRSTHTMFSSGVS